MTLRERFRGGGWIVFVAKCSICEHVWTAVVPDGPRVRNLECPDCHHFTGEEE